MIKIFIVALIISVINCEQCRISFMNEETIVNPVEISLKMKVGDHVELDCVNYKKPYGIFGHQLVHCTSHGVMLNLVQSYVHEVICSYDKKTEKILQPLLLHKIIDENYLKFLREIPLVKQLHNLNPEINGENMYGDIADDNSDDNSESNSDDNPESNSDKSVTPVYSKFTISPFSVKTIVRKPTERRRVIRRHD